MRFKMIAMPESTFTSDQVPKLRSLTEVFQMPGGFEHANILKLSAKKQRLCNIVLNILLCNSVSPIVYEQERTLQSASPDEIALVKFVEEVGFELVSRSQYAVEIRTPDGGVQKWEILMTFPFSSETQRMAVVVRYNKVVYFFMKGSDSAISQRIKSDHKLFVEEASESLASDGLRTLAFAFKIFSDEQLRSFKQEMDAAAKNLQSRDKLQLKVLENYDKELEVLGISGVEDMLQDNVKETVQTLIDSGINIWMLTGDKLETAKCIATSTGFKNATSKFFEISPCAESDLFRQLTDYQPKDRVLVLTGDQLDFILPSPKLTQLFF